MGPKKMWNGKKLGTGITYLVISKLLLLALPIAQIAIGAVYRKDCPQQPFIPVYVLVCGVYGVFLALLSCLRSVQEMVEGICNFINITRIVWHVLISAFWTLFSGTVAIYSIYPANYNQSLPGVPYCNKTLYLFAFWTTNLGHCFYLVFGGILLRRCYSCIYE